MFHILKSDKVIVDNIGFKNKISTNNNSYNIFMNYLHDTKRKDFIIQTPILLCMFGLSSFGNNKYLDLSFVNIDNDEKIRDMRDCINKINKHVLKHMRYKHKKYKSQFINSLKPNNGIYHERLRSSISDDILIFDKYNNKTTLDSIKSRTLVKALINVSHVWINNDKFGLYYNIVQLKTYGKLILNDYQFIDDDSDKPYVLEIPELNATANILNAPPPPPPPPPPPDNSLNPLYSKYFKMLSMGISTEAVKQKLLLDDLDPNIIDNNPSCDAISGDLIIKDDSDKDNKKDKPFSKKPNNLLLELSKGVKLKKAKIVKYKPKIEKDNLLVPSLWEIKNKLNTLKKTNKILY